MATASSSDDVRLKYDVFLSFSGEETRQGFTNTLFHFLKAKGIEAFIDDGLPRGEQIEASLMATIEQSKIAVVIFSEKYASSSWCLDELVKIKECNLIIMPIFYNVKPKHVQQQSDKFGDEFAKLKHTEIEAKIGKWSKDLNSVGTISGWDLANYRTEIHLIEDVAACILKKLDSFSVSSVSSRFIGIVSLVDDFKKLLIKEPSGVQFLGIWGMGGIGKTTIAEALYHQLSRQFEESYFAAIDLDMSSSEVIKLRNDIISHILGEKFNERTPNQPRTSILSRLQTKKVLIILDNASTGDQVTTLVGTKEDRWFASGSKVVVTSRDSIVFKYEDIMVRKIEEMSKDYSLRLFCLHAFKQNQCLDDEDYLRLSNVMVDYAKGVPLALKTLGSSLFGRTKNQWKSIFEKLTRTFLEPSIGKVLEISYEFLDETEKEIFLDVVCFFKGYDKDRVQKILDGCGFSATIGITRLTEKCLITVTVENKLEIHDLLQKMGWDIVEKNSRSNFGMRSRFWKQSDSYNLLTSYQKMEATTTFEEKTKAIEGIHLPMNFFHGSDFSIPPMVFSKMQNLRLLKFDYGSVFEFVETRIQCEVQFLPNNLRLLHWDRYPCEHLPSNFSAENVVELIMRCSDKLKQLWEGVQISMNLEKLKVLNLHGSKCLIELPELTSASNLEKIVLDYCVSLQEIPESVQHLRGLSSCSLSHCIKLQSLPSLVNIRTLRELRLFGCRRLKKFPETFEDIEFLDLRFTAVVEWPHTMSNLNNLKTLRLPLCFQACPSNLDLSSLKNLDLSFKNLREFPEVKGGVRRLYLKRSGIEELPSSIFHLTSLVKLSLKRCNKLQRIPDNFGQLVCLESLRLTGCSLLFKEALALSGLSSIKKLYLDRCGLTEFPAWTCSLLTLQELILSFNDFESVPESIKQLSLLRVLDLSYCRNLLSLPQLPSQVNDFLPCHSKSLTESTRSFSDDKEQWKQRTKKSVLCVHRLSFVGCEGLKNDARKDILRIAMMRIQRMANNGDKALRLSLPGNEIPESFNSCKGSSLTVDLPPNKCNNLFKGFVLCVIVDRMDYRRYFKYSCDFRSKDGTSLDSYCAIILVDRFCGGISRSNSGILFLQYSGDIYSPNRGRRFPIEEFENAWFSIYHSREKQLHRENHRDASQVIFHFKVPRGVQVLKCGVHLVYARVEDQNKRKA